MWLQFLLGGLETSQLVEAETISFMIPRLKEGTTYTVCVSAVIGGQEGSPTLLIAKTCEYRDHRGGTRAVPRFPMVIC